MVMHHRESLVDAVETSTSESLRRANFSLPGVIHDFDPQTARVSVYPAIDYLIQQTPESEITSRARPVIHDVPVVYPSGAGFSMTFPLAEGDPVLLIFSQRGLEDFKERLLRNKSVANSRPDEKVFFSVKDAMAIPGFIKGPASTPSSGVNFQTSSISVNGRPMFSSTGPLIAEGNLKSGSLSPGTPAIDGSLTLRDSTWSVVGDSLYSPTGPGRSESLGLLVRVLDSSGEVSRAAVLPGMSIALSGLGTETEDFHLIFHSRTGDSEDSQLLVHRMIQTSSPREKWTLQLPHSPSPQQTLATGLRVEFRHFWTGGP